MKGNSREQRPGWRDEGQSGDCRGRRELVGKNGRARARGTEGELMNQI